MKTHTVVFLFLLGSFSVSICAQRGIGTSNPDGSAILELTSTNKGFLLPRLTSAQLFAISSPAEGLMVYCTDCAPVGFYFYNGSTWVNATFGDAIPVVKDSNSAIVLAQVGIEANTDDTSVVNIDQLGAILPALTDVSVGNLALYQAYIDANAGLFSIPATQAEVQSMITVVNAAVDGDVVSSTGKVWMDRNLGASQVATSSSDALSYGDLYQWGRASDGHQLRASVTTGTTVTSASPGHALFITSGSGTVYNWTSFAGEDNLWQGVSGINNPCPSGYRIPTETELDAERATFSSNNAAGAFASVLKLPAAGYRSFSNGTLNNVGSRGDYWSSSVSGTSARGLYFASSDATVNTTYNRAFGLSVRCIKD